MIEEHVTTTPSKILPIIVTGIVSLVVGVGSGLLINYFTEKHPKLTYDITTQEVFSGQQNNIGIFALRVVNDGKKEIEQVTCHLWFSEGKLTERRVVGIPESARSVEGSEKNIDVLVPFFNPGEQFSIQVLLNDVRQPLARPVIEIRGKGVLGTEVSSQRSEQKINQTLPLLSVAIATVITALSLFLVGQHKRKTGVTTGRHFSEGRQRDVIAFVLETKGLDHDAQNLRESPRELTYWAASDALTKRWLQLNEAVQIRTGIEALELLIDYAALSDDSKRIILLNMSRLAIAIGNTDLAKTYLAAARLNDSGLIEKRINMDSALASLMKSNQGSAKY
jgi:hypothetical protein